MFKLSKNSIKNIKGVDGKLIEIIELALAISRIDFGIPMYGGLRTEKQQHTLFAEGKSKADGRYRKSKHQSGEAFDVFAYVDGKATWDLLYMSQVACAILEAASHLGVKLKWGGHWKNFEDLPHFELEE